MKTLKKVSVLLICCISIIWGGGCSTSNGKVEDAQNGIQKYLNHKYGIEFEFVKKPYLTGNEGDGYKYQAKVIPVGKPELEFFVEGDRMNSGTYIDGYLQTKWTYQGKQEVEKEIKKVFGEKSDYELRFEFRYNNEKFKEMNFKEVINACNGKAYINISLNLVSFGPFDKQVEAEKAFSLMKPFVLDSNINKYIFSIYYITKDFIKEYRANNNKVGKDDTGEVKGAEKIYAEKKLINSLSIAYLKDSKPVNIKSSKDIVNLFDF